MIHVIIKEREKDSNETEKDYKKEMDKYYEDLLNVSTQLAGVSRVKDNYKEVNKAIQEITLDARYVFIVSSGIIPMQGWDIKLTEEIKKDKKILAICPKLITKSAILVFAGISNPDSKANPYTYFYGFNQTDEMRYTIEGELNYISDDCLFIRASTIKNNLFDESFERYFADYKLSEKLRKKGILWFCPDVSMYFEGTKNLGYFNQEIYDRDGLIYSGETQEVKRGKKPVKIG